MTRRPEELQLSCTLTRDCRSNSPKGFSLQSASIIRVQLLNNTSGAPLIIKTGQAVLYTLLALLGLMMHNIHLFFELNGISAILSKLPTSVSSMAYSVTNRRTAASVPSPSTNRSEIERLIVLGSKEAALQRRPTEIN